jgi:cytochrome c-type biogenesis protein CcmH/NrfF
MRAEIDQMIGQGRSDAEILDYFKAKHGRRILVEPDGATGVWLSSVPVVLTVLGAGWVAWLLRRWSQRSAAATNPGTMNAG